MSSINNSKEKKSAKISVELSNALFDQFGLDDKKVSRDEWHYGVNVELEHGTEYPKSNITDNNTTMTAKIALAHVQEFPDYYKFLKVMEDFLEEKWKNRKKQIFSLKS